jgi:hypothetical protein
MANIPYTKMYNSKHCDFMRKHLLATENNSISLKRTAYVDVNLSMNQQVYPADYANAIITDCSMVYAKPPYCEKRLQVWYGEPGAYSIG